MTSATVRSPYSGTRLAVWGWILVSFVYIALDHWRPGTLATRIANYAMLGYIVSWFGIRVRQGYLLRRPYWTRESWLRYARLAAMPLVAVAVVLYFSSVDPTTDALGAPRSATRRISGVILLVLLLFGAGGLARVVDWMTDGDPSLPFTRTRWFQRQPPKVSAQ
jgi:hypothetical protein